MKFFAPAKINLSLDILKKDDCGLHQIKTIIQILPTLQDELTLQTRQPNDNLSILKTASKKDASQLPPQNENLAFRALKLIKQYTGITEGVHIHLTKKIPLDSGLGGGASDAATVLKALNQLWNLQLSVHELANLGAILGKDVPVFIYGGTALAENYGEKITPLPEIKGVHFSLTPVDSWSQIPVQNPKTQNMYAMLDLNRCGQNATKTTSLLNAIKFQNPKEIIQNLHNDFETILPTPKGRHLSGAGPSTFTATLI